jgi:hypothetical protein
MCGLENVAEQLRITLSKAASIVDDGVRTPGLMVG